MAAALPHALYIAAVTDALTAAGLPPEEVLTGDSETRGVVCYLNAVITVDDLLLIWEWHTGAEEGEPERGPQWLFAALKADGSSEYPTELPVYGYAAPAAVVDAARKVIAGEIGAGSFYDYGTAKWDGGIIGDSWEGADELESACEAWGAKETASA
jgi:hypothetical protein